MPKTTKTAAPKSLPKGMGNELKAEVDRLRNENERLKHAQGNKTIRIVDAPRSAAMTATAAATATQPEKKTRRIVEAKGEPKTEPKAKAPRAVEAVEEVQVEIKSEDILYLLQCYAKELGVPREQVLEAVTVIAQNELKSLTKIAAALAPVVLAANG